MLYHIHEMQHLAMMPARFMADIMRHGLRNPFNPIAGTSFARHFGSAAEVFSSMTTRYGKPAWNIETVEIGGKQRPVTEEVMIRRSYCQLLRFKREGAPKNDPKLLIVAPLSGHFATLLRGTVEGMLPNHDVYITDWLDCRQIPVTSDRFNLNDYIDYVIDFLHFLGPNTHVIAVCQPSVPVLAAASVMSGWGDLCAPASMTLIGGPIDTRANPTAVNKLAKEHTIEWFEQNVIAEVPPPYTGAGRKVYPGFIQLTNFISMNFDRHMESMNQLFDHLVQGDEEEAEKRRSFYEEYLAVMDLPAEFYLQTVKTVFQDHSLPKNEMIARWHPVLPEKIGRTAILCVEGELDDISGVGQTKAALKLAKGLSSDMKHYHLQMGVGHYGVFNGGRFRRDVVPVINGFIREHDLEARARRAAPKRNGAKRAGQKANGQKANNQKSNGKRAA